MVYRAVLVTACLAGCGGSAAWVGAPEGPSSPPSPIHLVAQVTGAVAEPHARFGSILRVSWEQGAEGTAWVETRLKDEAWTATPAGPAAVGPQQRLVIGLPYGARVEWRIANDFGEGPVYSEPAEVRTERLPEGMPEPALVDWDPSRTDPAQAFLLGSINQFPGGWSEGTYWKFVLDRQGRLVWVWKTRNDDWSIYLRLANDGTHIVWDEATYWSRFDNGRGSKVHRSTLDGVDLGTLETPGLHHAFTELPDGAIAYGNATANGESLEILHPDGTTEELFQCLPFLEGLGEEYLDFCQSNALFYDPTRNTFLYSFYTHSAVFEIDRASGEVLHVWGHVPTEWTFDPPESAFHFQHGATWTDRGTLLLSTHRTQTDAEGVVREYEVDEADKVLRQVWSSGEGGRIFSPTAGEAHRLPNGNTLHNYGASPVVQEVAPDGTVVWDVRFESDRLIGRTVFLEDLYALLSDAP